MREHARVRGGHYASSRRHQARMIQSKEKGHITMELEDQEFNKEYRHKGADMPHRERTSKPRPQREGRRDFDLED